MRQKVFRFIETQRFTIAVEECFDFHLIDSTPMASSFLLSLTRFAVSGAKITQGSWIRRTER